MRVIKKVAITSGNSRITEAAFLDRQVRIPAISISAVDTDEPARERSTTERTRVVRKAQATTSVYPHVLDLTDFSQGAAGQRSPDVRPDERTTPPPVKSIDDMLAERDQEWEVRLQQAVAQAREYGFAQGSADTAAKLEADFHDRQQVLVADLKQLRTRWDDYLERLEPAIAELSFEIAQAVLDAPLPPNVKGVAARAISEAVEQMAGSAPIEILIHPVDFLRLQESGVVEQLESLHSGLRWEPRPDMKQGEWVVQSPSMTVRRLEEELLGTLRSRLGLLAVLEKDRTNAK
jgi:flagellar assembly protein FliH